MDSTLTNAPRERMIELEGRGGAIAGLEFGDAARPIDIVFVHANGFNARTYRTILAPLAEEFRILAVDQRGHGRSTLPAETLGRTSWDGLRDDLLALMATLDIRDVVLSGHSMGGTACVLAQAEAPERVRSLLLFDPVVVPSPSDGGVDPESFANSPLVQGARRRRAIFPDRAAVIAAYTGRGAFKTWPPEMLADYVADGFRERPDGEVELSCAPEWEASNFSSHAHDTWGAFERAQVPIRILKAEVGSTCREDPRFDALVVAGRLEAQVVPGTSHFLPMERPDLVRAELRKAAG